MGLGRLDGPDGLNELDRPHGHGPLRRPRPGTPALSPPRSGTPTLDPPPHTPQAEPASPTTAASPAEPASPTAATHPAAAGGPATPQAAIAPPGAPSAAAESRKWRRRPIIAFVGIDGSGKTTQAKDLARWLTASGVPAEWHENPGGRVAIDRFAQRLGRRNGIDLLGRYPFLVVECAVRWAAIARGLLRSRVRGKVAVMDRYAFCEYVVIRAREDRGERVARRFFGLFPEPDLTCFISVPPEVAKARIDARGYDTESISYLSALDHGYRTLPEFTKFVQIDGDASLDVVSGRLREAVSRIL